MNRDSLADRVVTYSDTVVAFALVNGFAFLIALGEPDIRCSIARVAPVIGGINLLLLVACSVSLVWLRRIEARLRAGEDEDELVDGFWQVIVRLRMILVWTFSLLVLIGIYGATFDTRCEGMLE